MANIKPFEENLNEYEQWFIKRPHVFKSEIEAIRKVLPLAGEGLEIGVGSGLFASALGIKHGIDPSDAMRKAAIKRNINAIEGIAEKLPYTRERFDYALMITTVCFVDNVLMSFKEAHRILKSGGIFIVAFVDKSSLLGKIYLKNKNQSLFYKDASFYSTKEIFSFLFESDFKIETTFQTVFGMLDMIKEIQEPSPGYGDGSFVVIKAIKN